jgi:hypothetical protein
MDRAVNAECVWFVKQYRIQWRWLEWKAGVRCASLRTVEANPFLPGRCSCGTDQYRFAAALGYNVPTRAVRSPCATAAVSLRTGNAAFLMRYVYRRKWQQGRTEGRAYPSVWRVGRPGNRCSIPGGVTDFSLPILGPIQRPIQWIPHGVKCSGRIEAGQSHWYRAKGYKTPVVPLPLSIVVN